MTAVADDEMRCEPVYDDQNDVIATARVSGDISEEGRAALAALVAAVRRQMDVDDAVDPGCGDRQQAAIEGVRERARRRGGAR